MKETMRSFDPSFHSTPSPRAAALATALRETVGAWDTGAAARALNADVHFHHGACRACCAARRASRAACALRRGIPRSPPRTATPTLVHVVTQRAACPARRPL